MTMQESVVTLFCFV